MRCGIQNQQDIYLTTRIQCTYYRTWGLLIDSFQGEYRWLSNFWPAVVEWGGRKYPTVEHAYQVAKFDKRPDIQDRIRSMRGPGQAKREAKCWRRYVRKDWSAVRVVIMKELLQQKFAIPTLREKLLQTGQVTLIEGNTWGDTFWGVCHGIGYNTLGKLLMEIRTTLQNER